MAKHYMKKSHASINNIRSVLVGEKKKENISCLWAKTISFSNVRCKKDSYVSLKTIERKKKAPLLLRKR